jgi:hypothetical protein
MVERSLTHFAQTGAKLPSNGRYPFKRNRRRAGAFWVQLAPWVHLVYKSALQGILGDLGAFRGEGVVDGRTVRAAER